MLAFTCNVNENACIDRVFRAQSAFMINKFGVLKMKEYLCYKPEWVFFQTLVKLFAEDSSISECYWQVWIFVS